MIPPTRLLRDTSAVALDEIPAWKGRLRAPSSLICLDARPGRTRRHAPIGYSRIA